MRVVKIIDHGLVPPDDPMFSNTYRLFSPHGSKRLTGTSRKSTAFKGTTASNTHSETSISHKQHPHKRP